METPRHFLRRIPGYSFLFGFYILLTIGTLVGGQTNKATEAESIGTSSPTLRPTVTSKQAEHESQTTLQSTASPASKEPSHKISTAQEVDSTTQVSPQHHPGPITAALASQGSSTSAPSTDLSTDVTHALAEQGTTATAPDTPSAINTRKGGAGQKSLTTTGEVKASPGAETTVSSTTMSKFSLKPSETTTRHRLDYQETTSTSTRVRLATEAEEPGVGSSEPRSSGNKNTGIILAIVLCVLLLLVIVGFLLCRRQRRSGSTSFHAAGWAGQVALPDDSGLDRDAEQGPATGPAGEGDAKRNTLVTFFGKRQSRLPSVAMEDISGKGEQDECQQLLDGDVSPAGAPEGAEEANGKLAAPSAQASNNTGESS